MFYSEKVVQPPIYLMDPGNLGRCELHKKKLAFNYAKMQLERKMQVIFIEFYTEYLSYIISSYLITFEKDTLFEKKCE